jgi:phytoene synthase
MCSVSPAMSRCAHVLTNILRDVGEDAARGRCYLPADDLALFGITASDVLNDPLLGTQARWRALMRYEIARARALYEAAAPGIALLEGDAQRCARACAEGYAAILGAIEGINYSSAVPAASCGTDGPVIRWGERELSRPEEMYA